MSLEQMSEEAHLEITPVGVDRYYEADEPLGIGEEQGLTPSTQAPEELPPELRSTHGISLEHLVLRARGGDPFATNKVAEICSKIAFSIVHKEGLFLGGIDDEFDLCQSGLEAIVIELNANKYDASRSSFGNYAYIAIRNRMLTAIRNTNSTKRATLRSASSLDATLPDTNGEQSRTLADTLPSPYTVEQTAEDRETFIEVAEGMQKLTELERTATLLLARGSSYDEMQISMSVSRKSIDNALMRAKKKIRNHLDQKSEI